MDILINTPRTQIFSEIDFIFPYYFSISVLFNYVQNGFQL